MMCLRSLLLGWTDIMVFTSEGGIFWYRFCFGRGVLIFRKSLHAIEVMWWVR
jgi:hypothetical protein